MQTLYYLSDARTDVDITGRHTHIAYYYVEIEHDECTDSIALYSCLMRNSSDEHIHEARFYEKQVLCDRRYRRYLYADNNRRTKSGFCNGLQLDCERYIRLTNERVLGVVADGARMSERLRSILFIIFYFRNTDKYVGM